MITTVSDKEREQAATIERLTAELDSRLDSDLDKILAMSDEQVTALTRLEGSNPDDVAALARKAMQCAVLTVERDELRADLDAERDAAELKSACITGMRQEITAWSITAENLAAELERERIRLAACGVVALSDTPDSAAKARQMLPEYESASCDDVKRRVDECMSLRAERDGLKVKLDEATCLLRNAQQRESYWSDRFGDASYQLDQAVSERDALKSDAAPVPQTNTLSWSGFNIHGNDSSIKEVQRLVERCASLEQYLKAAPAKERL